MSWLQVLALLFMARADVGYTVRQAAVHVWKTIVTNTPRTTGEILKTLMDQIIISLAHTSKLLCFLPTEVHAQQVLRFKCCRKQCCNLVGHHSAPTQAYNVCRCCACLPLHGHR